MLEARAAFPFGAYPLRIEETKFSYANYAAELARNQASIAAFKAKQQDAFEAERQRWKEAKIDVTSGDAIAPAASNIEDIPDGYVGVFSEVPGCLWKLLVNEGDSVAKDDPIAIVESMKMEITITAPDTGHVSAVRVKPGQTLNSGDVLALIAIN